MNLFAALLALSTTTTQARAPQPVDAPAARTTLAAPSCGACSPPSAPRQIRNDTVIAAMNDMLRSEGLTPIVSAFAQIRPIELDGDPGTEEALVDVIAPELCDATGQCMTIVVRALRCGRLAAVGHGRWLAPLDSRTNRWMDLAETSRVLLLVPVTLRALHFDGARYGA